MKRNQTGKGTTLILTSQRFAYKLHPHYRWYVFHDDDTFIVMHRLLALLTWYDSWLDPMNEVVAIGRHIHGGSVGKKRYSALPISFWEPVAFVRLFAFCHLQCSKPTLRQRNPQASFLRVRLALGLGTALTDWVNAVAA